jgi:hypothetical protein
MDPFQARKTIISGRDEFAQARVGTLERDDPKSRGPRCPVRHSAGRDDFSTQLLDRRAVPHGRLPDQPERVRFGKIVSAHDLQNRGEHHTPGADAVL